MNILEELENQRDRIDAAISALSDGRVANVRRRTGARRLSAAARKKISDAAKARWAKAKRAGKKSL
jgi:hypothetical protein